jgi:DNA-binding winged helix-turn-helix (wHTH) protein
MTGRFQSKVSDEQGLPRIVSTLPMFIAHCLFDGDSYPFHEFILNRIHVLGSSWGQEVIGRRIGHANECDAIYQAMRSTDRVLKDRELAEQHAALVQRHGSERNLWIFQSREYTALLGLSGTELPCIACEAGTDTRSLAVLRIDRRWYADAQREHILSESLQEGLGSEAVRGVIPSLPMEADEMAWRMQRHLDGLRDRIDRRMRGVQEDSGRSIDETWLQTEVAAHALVVVRGGHCAYVHGKPFNTTPLPFRLLVALAECASSANAFLSRDEAGNWLWAGDRRTLTAFDSVVHRLRQDLATMARTHPGRELTLETHRGRGYRLTLAPDDVLVV